MFNFLKLTHVKSQAQSIIIDQLRLQYKQSFFHGDPLYTAYSLVKLCTVENLKKYDGSIEKIPNKLTLAICALEYAIKDTNYSRIKNSYESSNYLSYIVIMGNLISEFKIHKQYSSFSMYDKYLVEEANKTLLIQIKKYECFAKSDTTLQTISKIMEIVDDESKLFMEENINPLENNFLIDCKEMSSEQIFNLANKHLSIQDKEYHPISNRYTEKGFLILYESAKKGHGVAQSRVARTYADGKSGVSKDILKAYIWVTLSMNNNGGHQSNVYHYIYKEMLTYDELKKANKILNEFL